MKIKFSSTLAVAGLALMTFTACRNDEPIAAPAPLGDYENGILVANEGNFGKPNASLSFIPNDLSRIDNDLYKRVNGEDLGDVLQHIAFNGDEAWLVVNNSNKIVIVNRYTLKKITEITGVNQPRYITFAAGNAYVTSDQFRGEKALNIIRVADRTQVGKIVFEDAAQQVVSIKDKVYVLNAGFGKGKKISILNTATNAITETLTLAYDINDMEVINGKVYVVGDDNINSYLTQLIPGDRQTTYTSLSLYGLKSAQNLEADATDIYFSDGPRVFKMSQNAQTAPAKELFVASETPWSTLYGFNVVGDRIYTSNANGFTQKASITIYSKEGNVLKEFKEAGMGTNGFYKN